MRAAARLILGLLLVLSAGATVWQIRQLATGWPGSALVERARAGVAAQIDASLAHHATPERVIGRLDALLAQDPRDWIAIAAVEDVAAARDIPLPPDMAARRAALHDADHSLMTRAADCAACMWNPRACDFSAILICRVPIDLTPLGDIAGVTREGANFALGREVDAVDLTLSAIGLTAVAVAPLTGGTSLTVKAGAGLGKTAWRIGRLSPEIASVFSRAARNGFDWSGLRAARSSDDIAALARHDALRPAMAVLDDAGKMRAALGTERALYLLARADTAAEARALGRAAEAAGPRSLGALEVLGKQRLLRATMRWADEVWWAFGAVLATIAALGSLAASLAGDLVLRRLRRAAARPPLPSRRPA